MFTRTFHFLPFLYCLPILFSPSLAKTVEYDLYVRNAPVNFTGVTRQAMTINGNIPGPTLHFTEGDTAVIRVHNLMDTETSFHWHGLLVPNDQDGVPYLTSAPVKPHTTHTYTFPIIQNGTYWYHSHSGFQEQSGLYGAFIVRKRPDDPARRTEDALPEYTFVLSDWTNENPQEVNRMLHTGSDWFSIRKGSVQSYWEALRSGCMATKLLSEWKRMNAMDVSDVYYECFLLNGIPRASLPRLRGGDRIRLRIVNGASSTYFWLRYAGGKIRVVASDGKDVVPVDVDRMIIAVSETYDVILEVPESGKAFEFQATAEDTSGSSSLWLGHGERQPLRPFPKLNYSLEIVGCPIIREEDGLALSSRNARLSVEERKNALKISQTLFESRTFAASHTVAETQKFVEDAIAAAPGLRLEYFELVDGNTLQKIANWEDTAYAVGCITVFCGEVRLIDNIKYKE